MLVLIFVDGYEIGRNVFVMTETNVTSGRLEDFILTNVRNNRNSYETLDKFNSRDLEIAFITDNINIGKLAYNYNEIPLNAGEENHYY